MVEQVVSAKRYLETIGDEVPISGVVFMGMGEPFDNYERVMRAVKILTDPRAGLRLKASKVTVSTVGLVPQIEQFCTDPENGASMAISLHSVTPEVRDKIIPVNRRYPLELLSATLRKHFPRPADGLTRSSSGDQSAERFTEQSVDGLVSVPPIVSKEHDQQGKLEMAVETVSGNTLRPSQPDLQTPEAPEAPEIAEARGTSRRGRRYPLAADAGSKGGEGAVNGRRGKNRILAVEYTLLKGVNDSVEDAERLATWLEGIRCVVNLITFNPHEGTPFTSASRAASSAFREVLLARGLLCTYRDSRGDDGMAACGQLGGESMTAVEARHGTARKPIPVTVAWHLAPDKEAAAGAAS